MTMTQESLQKLSINDVLNEAKTLSQDDAPIRLRNSGRSLTDAFKLFLGELGGVIYGYDFVANLSTKIRFAFIVQHLPELREYNDFAKKLNKLRDKTEHSDTYFPTKDMLDALIPKAESLFGQLDSLIEKLRSQNALVDLRAQRKLLTLFLDWLKESLDGYEQAHRSFSGREPPQEEVKKAVELIALKDKVDEMSLDAINDCLNEVRQTISEIDGFWSELSDLIDVQATIA